MIAKPLQLYKLYLLTNVYLYEQNALRNKWLKINLIY